MQRLSHLIHAFDEVVNVISFYLNMANPTGSDDGLEGDLRPVALHIPYFAAAVEELNGFKLNLVDLRVQNVVNFDVVLEQVE